MLELMAVTLAAALAGFIDAIAGGGGLILVPALFSAYPGAAPATLFGTNKGAAVWGTAWATAQYARRVHMNWPTLAPAAVAALFGSLLGAWSDVFASRQRYDETYQRYFAQRQAIDTGVFDGE